MRIVRYEHKIIIIQAMLKSIHAFKDSQCLVPKLNPIKLHDCMNALTNAND